MLTSRKDTSLIRQYYRRIAAAAAAAICMSMFLGCENTDKMVPVHGTVTLEGSPVEGAVVAFLPEAGGRPSTGRTKSDGTFKQGDGVLIGAYRVTVTAVEEGAGGNAQNEDELGSLIELQQKQTRGLRWRTPQKYSDVDTSELRFEVKSGQENIANFDLKKQ